MKTIGSLKKGTIIKTPKKQTLLCLGFLPTYAAGIVGFKDIKTGVTFGMHYSFPLDGFGIIIKKKGK